MSKNENNATSSQSPKILIKTEPIEETLNNHTTNTHNTNTTTTINRNPVQLVPVNLPQTTTILLPQPQTNIVQTQLIPTSNIVPISLPQQFITNQLMPNPTLPPPPSNPSALHALQQSLKFTKTATTIKQEMTSTNKISLNTNSNNKPLQQYHGLPSQHTYLSQPKIQSRKDEILTENWTAKIAYAATLSSIINETAKLYKEKAEIQLKPKWTDLLYKLNGNSNNRDSNESKQQVYDEAIDHIFKKSEIYLKEISSTMSETKITESIGMMKGLTDAVCNLINNASIHLPASNPTRMRHLFENKLLIMWCSLLLRATTDVRDAMQRYLTHQAFNRFFHYKIALNGEFDKYLSSDEKFLLTLRTQKEQHDFEANTKKYVEEANLALMAVREITVLPKQDSNYVRNKKRVTWKDGDNGPKPPKKRRKKSRYQLFRVDGTPRRRQQNPCDRRICKRMWQSDGVTRGCGQNSHPRGVCPCWKKLKFAKEDEKNGNILKWLEKEYKKKIPLLDTMAEKE
eukprot:45883_1